VLERDAAKRAKLYDRAASRVRKTSPFVMLYQQRQVAAMRTYVVGFGSGRRRTRRMWRG